MSAAEKAPTTKPTEPSLYARVMADPEAREAFYWATTTDAYFSGDPADPIVQVLKSELDSLLVSRNVRVSFLDDEYRSHPELRICGINYPYLGEREIRWAAAKFLTREALDHTTVDPIPHTETTTYTPDPLPLIFLL